MIISHRHKFIFVKTAKTAGTSIEVYLSRFCGPDDIATPVYPPCPGHRPQGYRGRFRLAPELALLPRIARGRGFLSAVREFHRTCGDYIRGRRFHNHLPAYKIRCRIGERIWEDYFTFCVERNPWDKTLSHYAMLAAGARRALSLDTYLARKHFCWNYWRYMDPGAERIIVDSVVKYEDLDAGLGRILKRLDIPFPGSLPVRAKGNYRPPDTNYRQTLAPEQSRLIAEAFEREISLHGFVY